MGVPNTGGSVPLFVNSSSNPAGPSQEQRSDVEDQPLQGVAGKAHAILPPSSQRGEAANRRLCKQTPDEIWKIFQQHQRKTPLCDFMRMIDPEAEKLIAYLPLEQLQWYGLTDLDTLVEVLVKKHENKGELKFFIGRDISSPSLYLYNRDRLQEVLNTEGKHMGFLARFGLVNQAGRVDPDDFASHVSKVDYQEMCAFARDVLVETYLELPEHKALLDKYIPGWLYVHEFSTFVGKNEGDIETQLSSLKTKRECTGRKEKIAELEKLNELMKLVQNPETSQYDMEEIRTQMEKRDLLSVMVTDRETIELRTWSDQLQRWKDAEDFVDFIKKLFDPCSVESIDTSDLHLFLRSKGKNSPESIVGQ